MTPNFSIAAAFGNVHGVYKPGNVKLNPGILATHQASFVTVMPQQLAPLVLRVQ